MNGGVAVAGEEAVASLVGVGEGACPIGKSVIADSDALFSADPAHMAALLTYLRDRYGTVAAYADAVGIPAAVVTALRSELLEPAGSA